MKGFGDLYKSEKEKNNKTKSSKEEIINKAIKFHSQGNIPEAAKYYQLFINEGFNDHRVFSNYGLILRDLGKLQEAELSTRKAIELNPNYANAYSNLGLILRDLGKLQEAELSTRKAIEINPNFADAHSNLGSILKDLGKLQEAELSTRKAIELNPNYAYAYSNLGSILNDLGKLQEAETSYRKAIELNPNYANAYSNLGNVLSDLGKLQEAELSYRKAIEINPNFADAHYNLGNLLSDIGKLQEAETSYRKAIELNPNYANAYSNLGNVLSDLGKLQEAELSYRKAIEINPNFADAHSNLGSILKDLGKLQEAELSTRKAIELNPDYAMAHSNLGNILSDLGNFKEAFDSFLKVIELEPTFSSIYPSITRFLKDSDLSKLNKSKLKQILSIIIERNDVSHKELFKAFNFIYGNELLNNCEALDLDFYKTESILNNKLVINGLKKIIFTDLKLEGFLSIIRRRICDLISKNERTINYSSLDFIIGLGEQCFFNEYIYSITKEEKINLNTIINRCTNGELNEINISILSCYYPLYKLLDKLPSLKSFTSLNPSFNELIELQIIEPLKEIELSKRIKKLGTINNAISLKVRTQYEENPYPRWRYSSYSENQKTSWRQDINNDIKPNYISQSLDDEKLKVLIAGCGTGNQILQTQRYKNAQITAIDLSLTSLAYAQRKINELGLQNVELIQMDILEIGLLKEKFDVIECGGVLHHMDDPSAGLKALLGVLKNNCFLKLALYSELARQDVVMARKYIQRKKLQSNENNILNFRKKIISGELSDLNSLKLFEDFYSLSEFRDLCFHAQEHRFTIQQLQNIINSNKLQFLGFLLPKQVKSLYKKYFPEDEKQTNLQNWSRFEEKNPKTFISMYQFWVSNVNNE